MVNIDRMHVKEAFKAYVSDYDLSDVKVKLKVDHTYRVAAMCDAITEDLGLSAADRDLAWLSGMLHDIGRFEQLRQYHTFQDRLSCNHAMLSADILFHDGKLRLFVRDAEEDELALLEKTYVSTTCTASRRSSVHASTASPPSCGMQIKSTSCA